MNRKTAFITIEVISVIGFTASLTAAIMTGAAIAISFAVFTAALALVFGAIILIDIIQENHHADLSRRVREKEKSQEKPKEVVKETVQEEVKLKKEKEKVTYVEHEDIQEQQNFAEIQARQKAARLRRLDEELKAIKERAEQRKRGSSSSVQGIISSYDDELSSLEQSAKGMKRSAQSLNRTIEEQDRRLAKLGL